QVRSKCEIEEVELDQRRRVAKELDVARGERAHEPQPRALRPGAEHSDDDARDDAQPHQSDGSQEPVREAHAVERIIKDGELNSRCGVEFAKPVPERREVGHVSRDGPSRWLTGSVRALSSGMPTARSSTSSRSR